MSFHSPWAVKFPRKPRQASSRVVVPPLPSLTFLSASSPHSLGASEGLARPGVSLAGEQEGSTANVARRERKSDRARVSEAELLANRMRCGRTAENLLSILHSNPFNPTSCNTPLVVQRRPFADRGLTATFESRPVYIDSVRGPDADVGFLAEAASGNATSPRFTIGRLTTVKSSCLVDVRFEFAVVKATGSQLLLERSSNLDVRSVVANLGYADASVFTAPPNPERKRRIDIVPKAAIDHTAKYGSQSEPHNTCARNDRCIEPCWVLDIPSHQQFWKRPHRCTTCQNAEGSNESADGASYFPVTDDDVKQSFPGVLSIFAPRQKTVYMTVPYLIEILLSFWETFNARAVRRSLVSIVSANALASQLRMERSEFAPYNIAFQISATPKSSVLRHIVMKAFCFFIDGVVAAFQVKQFVYNGAGVRHDGNYDISTRVIMPGLREGRRRYGRKRRLRGRRRRCGKVVIAFTGLDGSLLAPPAIAPSEAYPDIDALLAPMLDELKAARLRAGCALEDSIPVFHATDSYRGQRFKLAKTYAAAWPELRVDSVVSTRTARVKRRRVLPTCPPACRIVGDPQHDIINLAKLLHGRACDKKDLLHDHIDVIHRVSGPAAPAEAKGSQCPEVTLDDVARQVLRNSVLDTLDDFNPMVLASERAVSVVKSFLELPHVQESDQWVAVFGSHPPRGTLARAARRLDASLHPSSTAYRWKSKKAFKREVRRIRKWYKTGKKNWRYFVGIPRSPRAPQKTTVRGLAKTWTSKVNLNYKRLLSKIRLQGLFAWSRIAKSMRLADLSLQTGTVSVERIWSAFKAMLPAGARCMRKEWFDLLTALFFLRFNIRHFLAGRMPPWLENYSILSLRIDTIIALAKEVHAESPGVLIDFALAFP